MLINNAKTYARSAGLSGYSQLVSELGGEANQLITLSGLSPEALDDPNQLIPAKAMAVLLEKAARSLECETFGLQLSIKQNPSILGLVGITMQQCETFGEALSELKRFLHTHSQAGRISVDTSERFVTITFEALVTYDNSERQLTDLSLSAGYQILNSMCQDKLSLESAYFRYSAPRNQSLHQKLFRCPIYFDREYSALVLHKSSLQRSISPDKSFFKDFISGYMKEISTGVNLTVDEQIRVLVRQLLPSRRCNMRTICDYIGVDTRTLQRRLKEQGKGFQKIVTEERKSLAITYLKQTEMSITQISEMLGYSEISVFSRNFQLWTGQTPTEYLRQQGTRWQYR